MTTLDLRSVKREDHRDAIFETLDDVAEGEAVSILTDQDIDVPLHHYQIKRERRLRWESAQRDGDGPAVRVTKGPSFDVRELTEFDVRDMPPQRRHEVLTDTFDRLDPGEGFVLVNDHDPKPLYHELRSTRGEIFEWEYAKRESGEWRVEIVKTDDAETANSDAESADDDAQSTGDTQSADDAEWAGDDAVASFDVREIPKRERHPTIHHRYGNIVEGDAMEIVAPHEPRPLRREFQERYGESFAWDVVEKEPGRCRVRITKRSGDDEPTGDSAEPSSADVTVTEEFDIRDLPPAQRHERIFETYADLELGEGFVFVNDHDPKPLYHQFDAEAGDEFHWEYRQQEPGEFKVLIGKTESTNSELEGNESPDPPF